MKAETPATEAALADATQRFITMRTAGYTVVHVPRIRCPHCQAIATGRPQRSERTEQLSVQMRRCSVCNQRFAVVIE